MYIRPDRQPHQKEMCPYCKNPFTNRAKHWCINCPVMDFERRNIQDYLTEEQFAICNLQDFKLVAAILNSQNSRKYKELLKLLKKFPF